MTRIITGYNLRELKDDLEYKITILIAPPVFDTQYWA